MAKKRKTLPKEIDDLLKAGDVEALKQCLSRCEPNAQRYGKYGSNIFAQTPLPREFAIWAKEYGADVNFRDYNGDTPIFYQICSWNGDVQLLIDLGADLSVTQYTGETLLHKAARYGRPAAVKALLDAGAEVDAQAKPFMAYRTPLEMAVGYNLGDWTAALEVCELLLAHGAQITDKTREAVRQAGEALQQRGITDPEYLTKQGEALDKLYKLFGVEPAAENIIDAFLVYMKGNGWEIALNSAYGNHLPEAITSRYTNIPELWLEFVGIIKHMVSPDETMWFLSAEDFEIQGDKAWRWNEWELRSIESANGDAEWEGKIKKFWDNHLPIVMSVKDGYSYYAISMEDGSIVKGCEPEFEACEFVAPSFEDFIEGIIKNKRL